MKQTPFPWWVFQHFLVPQSCVLCDKITINRDFSQICGSCFRSLEKIPDPVCAACGKPLPGWSYSPVDICSECRINPPEFDTARAWGPYQGGLRTLIRKLKYQGLKPLASPLAELLHRILDQEEDPRFDWIVPVPLHRKRLRERGFNQAELLARRLSRKTGVPLLKGIIRGKETSPQFGLSPRERRKNMAGAFTVSGTFRADHSRECRILVLDDVLTTGATVSSLCKCLRIHLPVDFIQVLTVARAIKRNSG